MPRDARSRSAGTASGQSGTLADSSTRSRATGRPLRPFPPTPGCTSPAGAIPARSRGDHSTADRVLCETLEISATTGIRAPLLDHGAHIRPVLERISGDLGPSAVTALDLLDRLHPHGAVTLVEPLTKREIDVLQHLPTLMTNAEIARGLRMSINTVKTHLKAVYRKLGVEGRRAAVLRGRDLELL
jgi:LuxR family transcriptional regulator, maltose regulon positive regulatory protein